MIKYRYFLIFFVCKLSNEEIIQSSTILGYEKFPTHKTIENYILLFVASSEFSNYNIQDVYVNAVSEISEQDVYDYSDGEMTPDNISDLHWNKTDSKEISKIVSEVVKEDEPRPIMQVVKKVDPKAN